MNNATSFWNTNVGKTVKTAIYLGVSSVLSYLLTAVTNSPSLFGQYTVAINLVIVFIQKTVFDQNTPNFSLKLGSKK